MAITRIEVLSTIVDENGIGEACIYIEDASGKPAIVSVPFFDVGEACDCYACRKRVAEFQVCGPFRPVIWYRGHYLRKRPCPHCGTRTYRAHTLTCPAVNGGQA